MVWIQAGTVQAIRTKKYAVTDVKLPSILQTPSQIKWARRKLAFWVTGINSTMLTQSIIQHTSNALSAAELQKNATVLIQAQSTAAAIDTVEATVVPFLFDGSKLFRML